MASVLKSNCNLILTSDFEGQGHILFPMVGYVGVHVKVPITNCTGFIQTCSEERGHLQIRVKCICALTLTFDLAGLGLIG